MFCKVWPTGARFCIWFCPVHGGQGSALRLGHVLILLKRRVFGARPVLQLRHSGPALEVQSFHSPCGRAGNFSLLVQRKVTKRNTPQVARPPGILPQKRSLVAFAPAQSFYVRERSQPHSDLNRSCVEEIEESLCFCGRMPPERGPLWRGEGAKERPEGWRAGCAPVRCAHRDVRSANPVARSRTRRAGCPESAPPGVCFFGYFLCTSKESDPLARRASGSLALERR